MLLIETIPSIAYYSQFILGKKSVDLFKQLFSAAALPKAKERTMNTQNRMQRTFFINHTPFAYYKTLMNLCLIDSKLLSTRPKSFSL